MSKNVEKVLNLASIEKNRIQLNLEEIHVHEVLKETVEHFKQTDFGQKAIVKFKLNEDDEIVFADKFHFSNLILNILENSAKYCEQVPLIIINLSQAKDFLHLNFLDNGIGISKDQRKKIFKKFYRVPTGNLHDVRGFGLGLSYVKKIIEEHKGLITVSSELNKGSHFEIFLPSGIKSNYGKSQNFIS